MIDRSKNKPRNYVDGPSRYWETNTWPGDFIEDEDGNPRYLVSGEVHPDHPKWVCCQFLRGRQP